MRLERTSVPMHGIRWHEEPGPRGLCWWQYWCGVMHTWYWCGVPIWWCMKRRDRPMHKFIRRLYA